VRSVSTTSKRRTLQCGEDSPHFDPREIQADTDVWAGAEDPAVAPACGGRRSSRDRGSGVRHGCRPIDHDRPGTRRQQGSVNVYVPRDVPGEVLDRRVDPQDLADGTGSQGRVFTDQIPPFWMLGEQPDGAADREDRRVEARTHVVDRHDWTRLRGHLAPVNGVVDRLVPAAGFHFSRYRFVLCVARHLVEDRKRLDRHRGSSRLTVLPAGVGAEMSA
jgi:hypothetical protein